MDTSLGLRYNDAIQATRAKEYPKLQDLVYLDHAGTTPCSRSLMDRFSQDMITNLYGNPHSASSSSQHTTSRVENARLRLLNFLGADPDDFDLIFVANATAGVKLVVDGMRSLPQGFLFAHHQACHTSIVGAREEAQTHVCLDDAAVEGWLRGEVPLGIRDQEASATLVAFSGQSHMDGGRYPLSWSWEFREHSDSTLPRVYTLLDAASLAATSPLDLSDSTLAPDFTVLSLYKIFGFPDLGALIVRRNAEHVFSYRKYFGGGTVDMVVCGKEEWHAPKSEFLHERLEDGTLPFHSIIALDIAISVHESLFGSMDEVRKHTSRLTRQLIHELGNLQHGNGQPACVIYADGYTKSGRGPSISFNLKNSAGAWVSLADFDKLATLKDIHVRTGSVCAPGAIAAALRLEPWEIKRNFSAGYRCGTDSDIMSGKPTGIIRASLGAMSTNSDICKFVEFLKEFFVESSVPEASPQSVLPDAHHITATATTPRLEVKAITVFPLKSCGGLTITRGARWEVRPEGLAWDREWCLVHRGSGQALSQKRYPQMALLEPSIDFEKGALTIRWRGKLPREGSIDRITVPLSADPSLFDSRLRHIPSKVCGEEISPYVYSSTKINIFFSECLGVPCLLTRFPAGGRGLGSRSSKARFQTYQRGNRYQLVPGAFPDIPSPPESDSEQQKHGNKILLANESPILMIQTSSVDALNREIMKTGGVPVDETAFRANITFQPVSGSQDSEPFSEDTWSSLRIGLHEFKLLGACRRCQMVCVDQTTGEKKQEPYVTLAKTRRFDGKVYFGCHMSHVYKVDQQSQETQCPTIQVGDPVAIEDDQ